MVTCREEENKAKETKLARKDKALEPCLELMSREVRERKEQPARYSRSRCRQVHSSGKHLWSTDCVYHVCLLSTSCELGARIQQ